MKKGYIYIIITAIIFSTIELTGKIISTKINPFQLTFIRFFIGGLVLLPFALRDLRAKKLRLGQNDYRYFLLNGTLCIAIGMCIYQLGILHTKASTVAIIFSTNPIFTVPFASLILKEKITKTTLTSLGFSILGIAFILNPFHLSHDYLGILLAILSAIIFSLYSVIGKLRVAKYGSYLSNSFTFLLGDLVLLVILLIAKVPILSGISTSSIPIILYLGILGTGIGYVFYFLAMKETSAIAASTVFFIKPALAPILSLFILHESLHTNTLLGIAFILLGSYFTIFKKKNTAQTNESATQ